MKNKPVVSIVIFFLLFLTGCDSQLKVGQTPNPAVKTIMTIAPNPVVTIISGATPSPTFSAAQETEISLRALDPYFQQTQDFWFEVEHATLEAKNVKCKDGFFVEIPFEVLRVSNDEWSLFTCSPVSDNEDDKWTPAVVDYGNRYTQISKSDLSTTWIIEHNTFDYSFINRPNALMHPYRWTADGKFLYLYPRVYPGPGGFSTSYVLKTNILDLYRINLVTGDFELVLRRDQFGAIALSPDDKLLAYSEEEKPDIIHIRDMESGKDLQVKLNEDIIASGAFVWDSKSTMVVFTIGFPNQGENWQNDLSATSIFVLDPKTMDTRRVLAKDARIFVPYECSSNNYWIDENTLCLYSYNEELESFNNFFTLDLLSGTVQFLRPFGSN